MSRAQQLGALAPGTSTILNRHTALMEWAGPSRHRRLYEQSRTPPANVHHHRYRASRRHGSIPAVKSMPIPSNSVLGFSDEGGAPVLPPGMSTLHSASLPSPSPLACTHWRRRHERVNGGSNCALLSVCLSVCLLCPAFCGVLSCPVLSLSVPVTAHLLTGNVGVFGLLEKILNLMEHTRTIECCDVFITKHCFPNLLMPEAACSSHTYVG